MRFVSYVALALLAACDAPPVAPAAVPNRGGTCVVRGRVRPRSEPAIFVGAEPGAPVMGLLTGDEVDVTLEPTVDTRAAITLRSGGFELSGFVAPRAILLYTRRDVDVAPGHVAIARGEVVRPRRVDGDRMVVEALYDDFQEMATFAPCDALALVGAAGARPSLPGGFVHMVPRVAPLFGSPGGAVVARLSTRRPGVTLSTLGASGGFTHVRYDEGHRIDGWLRDADVAPGEGPDCDDCRGPGIADARDRCPDTPDAQDHGCPDTVPAPTKFTATREAPIRDAPSDGARVLGRVIAGGEVYLYARQDRWARVRPVAFVVAPRAGQDFWVDAAAIGAR